MFSETHADVSVTHADEDEYLFLHREEATRKEEEEHLKPKEGHKERWLRTMPCGQPLRAQHPALFDQRVSYYSLQGIETEAWEDEIQWGDKPIKPPTISLQDKMRSYNEEFASMQWLNKIDWQAEGSSEEVDLLLDLNDQQTASLWLLDLDLLGFDNKHDLVGRAIENKIWQGTRERTCDRDAYNISYDEFYAPRVPDRTSSMQRQLSISHSPCGIRLDRILQKKRHNTNTLNPWHRPKLNMTKAKLKTSASVLALASSSAPSPTNTNHNKYVPQREEELSLLSSTTTKPAAVVLIEYIEEHPVLLSNTGMESHMITYYRQTGATVPVPKHGTTLRLNPGEDSPFLGNVRTNRPVTALSNNLFIAPLFPHQPSINDFMLIRNKKGGWFIRELPPLYLAGQLHPKIAVPNPGSKAAKRLLYKHIPLFLWHMLDRDVSKATWIEPPVTTPRVLYMDQLLQIFGPSVEMQARKVLKLREINYHRESGLWMRGKKSKKGKGKGKAKAKAKDAEEETKEAKKREEETDWSRCPGRAEDVCVLESMEAAHARLREELTPAIEKLTPDYSFHGLADLVAGMSVNSTVGVVAAHVERRLQIAPWNQTQTFIDASDGKFMMTLKGKGNPLRKGEGFAFVTTVGGAGVGNGNVTGAARKGSEKKRKWARDQHAVDEHAVDEHTVDKHAVDEDEAAETKRATMNNFNNNNKKKRKVDDPEKKKRKELFEDHETKPIVAPGEVTGTECDLRRLTMQQMLEQLVKLGMQAKKIKPLTRWERVAMIRELANQRPLADGNVELQKYARQVRSKCQRSVASYMREQQDIFDRQCVALACPQLLQGPAEDDAEPEDLIFLRYAQQEEQRKDEEQKKKIQIPKLPPPRKRPREKETKQQQADEDEAEWLNWTLERKNQNQKEVQPKIKPKPTIRRRVPALKITRTTYNRDGTMTSTVEYQKDPTKIQAWLLKNVSSPVTTCARCGQVGHIRTHCSTKAP